MKGGSFILVRSHSTSEFMNESLLYSTIIKRPTEIMDAFFLKNSVVSFFTHSYYCGNFIYSYDCGNTLLTMVRIVKAVVFSVVIYGC